MKGEPKMWKRLFYEGYEIEAKVYETGSEYGIDGGRISKLWMRKDGRIALNYDRGWDVHPVDKDAERVYEYVLKKWN